MTTRNRQGWWIAAIALGTVVVASWCAIHPRTRDPYPFLKGHRVREVAVQGPGSWGPQELRTYSWKQPWRSVVAAARRDLPAFGLSERPDDPHREDVVWTGKLIDGGLCGFGTDKSVTIVPGRSGPLRYSEPLSDEDPDWVTVLVQSDIDDNWITILRYTFFSMGE